MSEPLDVPLRGVSSKFARAVKRLLDIVLSLGALLFLLPLFALTALCIWIEDGRPIFFIQPRAGRRRAVFPILKFRSMKVNRVPVQEMGQVREDHPLVTRTGRIIRRLKIDEFPQFWHVLTGEMSLVGPRPTIPEQVEAYTPFQLLRLEMPPGCTGWGQINGGTQLEWDDRIRLDVWYCAHWTLTLDFIIVCKTLGVLIFGERINSRAVEEARAFARSLE
ncbi:MAG: sugar transferase [Planctomycetota bacterium]|nr:sugar transferase [Planctomycetota bacterium]